MNTHKNARLAPFGRGAVVRQLMGGQRLSAVANVTPCSITPKHCSVLDLRC